MKILHDHHVPGMVLYENASEIPTFVAMEFINGPDLKVAIENHLINDWIDIVKVAFDLTKIIRSAHSLPERVLHRDIRPSNIMLKDYYSSRGEIQVVVLDFDLSWHRDSCERSVIHGSSGLGYLAPEQMQEIKGVTSRHTAVDAFGLGMTFYFMISGIDPIQENHMHTSWTQDVCKFSSEHNCSSWHSIPNRFARIIINSTADEQSRRWDVSQIEMELSRINDVLLDHSDCKYPELVAEEMVARSSYRERYDWNYEKSSAILNLTSGVCIEVCPDEVEKSINMYIKWQREDFHQRKKIHKWTQSAREKVLSIAKSHRWKLLNSEHNSDNLNINLSAPADFVAKSLDKNSNMINMVIKELTFN